MNDYLAHYDEKTQRKQTVAEHLNNTAVLAASFAAPFGAETEAYACGMLHDIGKYSDAFQGRLKGGAKTDHSTAGAQVAMKELRDPYISFCVAGHHAGLPDAGSKYDDKSASTLQARIKRPTEDFERFRKEIKLPKREIPTSLTSSFYDRQFFIRMLYSCLVDADFLDTEQFMTNGLVHRNNRGVGTLENKLNQYLSKWKNPESDLNRVRNEILRSTIEGAYNKHGLFTLTVPTGGGKTIASVAFALRHADIHHMRRVIYVIPYCSIIEQTQKQFEKIFGSANVIAHYANVDYETDSKEENQKRYLAAENWDAPIILTTAVQFFESLYGNRSSVCRKLHNIANSVIIFDEAQMMPVPYLIPCTEAISELVRNYHCSAVLCTATQPALNRLFEREEMLPRSPAVELCPKEFQNSKVFQRVRYQLDGHLTDDELAERIQSEEEVLCIVNNRKQAQEIFERMQCENKFHLSTRMTPRDRRRTLEIIRKLLSQEEPCHLVSTSLVEAGVDIDFPTVYRSYAGLDSMIQAGGRCNREGKRNEAESIVHIFQTDQKIPDVIMQNMKAAERAIDINHSVDSAESIKDYFEFLFYCLKDDHSLDAHEIIDGSNTEKFKTVSESFHLIENNECTVYIETGDNKQLIFQYRTFGPSRDLMRLLNLDSISIPAYQFSLLVKRGDIKKVDINTGILVNTLLYSSEKGISENVSDQGFII